MFKPSIVGTACLALALSAANANHTSGQSVRRSQRGTVSQTVDKTEISLTYNRPVARGRELFGGIVRWDRMWHPGANEATTIEFSDDVIVDGQPLQAGSYTLWTIPRRGKAWTFIFSSATEDGWHSRYPGEEHDALRTEIEPKERSHMETLTFYFPVVDQDSAVLNFHWGTTVISMVIELAGQD